MIAALFYLQFHSAKNRLMVRLRRFRQPKYLLGGLVGGIYVYFYFFRYLFGFGTARPMSPLAASPENAALLEGLGAVLLMVIVFLGWLLPRERAALAFSEAEVAFLFPAPISRRGLIHYKLLRSQAGILFTCVFLVLLSNRMGGKAWIHALGWWLVLSTLNLHFLGASFARTMLLDRGITVLQRRIFILALFVLGLLVVVSWGWHTFPQFSIANIEGSEDLKSYAVQLLNSGPLPWLLAPFRLVVRPYLALTGSHFILAALPAIALLGLHYIWVIRSDVAFEEASVDASRKLAEKVAAVRAGKWQQASKSIKARKAVFVLRPDGSPVVALLWKNLISAGQSFTWRLWLMLLIMGTVMSLSLGQSARFSNAASVLGIIIGLFLAWSLLLGPQLLRQDFRQDMQVADVLKMYPLRGWQVVLGELLAPVVILTVIQWFLVAIAMLLLLGSPLPGLTPQLIVGAASSVAVLVPVLNFLMLQIPNAAVLLFPAWFAAGKEGPHGIEATGQRIISVLGQMLAFVTALTPAGIAAAVIFFAVRLALGAPLVLALVAGACSAAFVVGLEAVLGVMLLGRFFERLDVSSEPLS